MILSDGFSTVVDLEGSPAIRIYARDTTPPGFSAGGPIDTTTMRNTAWRTSIARKLKTFSATHVVVAVATEVISLIKDKIGINQLMRITFPDGFRIGFWGWVDEFSLGAISEGNKSLASLVIQPSMVDVNGNETAPIYDEDIFVIGGEGGGFIGEQDTYAIGGEGGELIGQE